jgi:hypothetical protein
MMEMALMNAEIRIEMLHHYRSSHSRGWTWAEGSWANRMHFIAGCIMLWRAVIITRLDNDED